MPRLVLDAAAAVERVGDRRAAEAVAGPGEAAVAELGRSARRAGGRRCGRPWRCGVAPGARHGVSPRVEEEREADRRSDVGAPAARRRSRRRRRSRSAAVRCRRAARRREMPSAGVSARANGERAEVALDPAGVPRRAGTASRRGRGPRRRARAARRCRRRRRRSRRSRKPASAAPAGTLDRLARPALAVEVHDRAARRRRPLRRRRRRCGRRGRMRRPPTGPAAVVAGEVLARLQHAGGGRPIERKRPPGSRTSTITRESSGRDSLREARRRRVRVGAAGRRRRAARRRRRDARASAR